MSGAAGSEKPAVLIVGGLGMCCSGRGQEYDLRLTQFRSGYVGRFLALHLYKNDLASDVRLVDKQLPELAMLADEFKEACSRDRFMQADASNPRTTLHLLHIGLCSESQRLTNCIHLENLARIFDRPDGKQFDYVFNCGGETRYSQEDEVYRARSHGLSMSIGREAAARRVKCFVEISTGMVYKPDSVPRKETAKLKPWLKFAKWKLQAEEDLAKISGLNLVVLRLAHVYGPYGSKFLGTALSMARVYQSLGKELKWLYDRDLRTNTVHIDDLCRALWRAAEYYVEKSPWKERPVWNIVDKGNTSRAS